MDAQPLTGAGRLSVTVDRTCAADLGEAAPWVSIR
jgi:hypothetical protein